MQQRGKTNTGRDMDRNERAPGHAKTLATAVPTLRCHSVLLKPPSGWASLGRPLFLAHTRTSTLAQTSGSTWVNYKAAPSMLGRKGVREKLCKLGQKAREGRKEGRAGSGLGWWIQARRMVSGRTVGGQGGRGEARISSKAPLLCSPLGFLPLSRVGCTLSVCELTPYPFTIQSS